MLFMTSPGYAIDPAYLSALAALAGSAVGGLTSFLSSWFSQGAQLRAQLFLHDKGRRQELYRQFVEEASGSYIEALTHDTPDLSKTIALYALISRMRILSSPKIVEEAERVARLIEDSYSEKNKTSNDLRVMIDEHTLDPLRDFSESCRQELRGPALP
jgi:hypothetical protein